jgi:hypothetical protein
MTNQKSHPIESPLTAIIVQHEKLFDFNVSRSPPERK